MPSHPRDPIASEHDGPDRSRPRRLLQLAGLAVGLALLGAAVATVWRSRADLDAALAALRDPPPGATALVLASVVAGVFLSGLLFHELTKRFGAVPFWEMQCLIAAASLANYLPLKPGFIGRIAYLRARHGIRATDGVRTIVEAMGLTLLACIGFIGALVLLRESGIAGGWALLAPVALSPILLARNSWFVARALVIRQCELALWTLRYWAVFRLVGTPVELDAAVVLASVSVLATLVPFVSNGLGLREWVIGLLAPLVAHASVSTSQAIVAELVHRVAELVVIVPLGLLGFAVLARLDLRRLTPGRGVHPSA